MKLLLVAILLLTGCSPSQNYVKLAEEVLPKTVSIEVTGTVEIPQFILDKDGFRIESSTVAVRIRGAGVYISENNHVLTCDHLFSIPTIDTIKVCNYYGRCDTASILAQDYDLDLALLSAKADTASDYARIGDPRKLRVGQDVMAIGNPLGFSFSVSHGIISALGRDNVGVYNMTQSDAFINPGNSGGGLFNMKGELIGINSRMVPPVRAAVFTGLGFSTQCGQIIEFLTRFRGLDRAIPKYGYDYWSFFRTIFE